MRGWAGENNACSPFVVLFIGRTRARPGRFLVPWQLCSTSCVVTSNSFGFHRLPHHHQVMPLTATTPSHAFPWDTGGGEYLQPGLRFIKLSESRNAKRLREACERPARDRRERENKRDRTRMIPCQFNETIACARARARGKRSDGG